MKPLLIGMDKKRSAKYFFLKTPSPFVCYTNKMGKKRAKVKILKLLAGKKGHKKSSDWKVRALK